MVLGPPALWKLTHHGAFLCLDQIQSCLGLRTIHLKQVKVTIIIENAEKNPNTQRPPRTVYFGLHILRRSPRSQYKICGCYPG